MRLQLHIRHLRWGRYGLVPTWKLHHRCANRYKRLDRFILRSLANVNTRWHLYCLVHNIEKLAHRDYAQQRQGQTVAPGLHKRGHRTL
jgi:hypothetical protein